MVDLELIRCTSCGNQVKIKNGDETATCDACGNTFLVRQGQDLSKKKEETISQIKKLRENLKRAIDNDDNNAILHFSQEILTIIPSDYRAGYFSAYATSKLTNPQELYSFYKELNIEATQEEKDIVVEHLIKKFDLRDYKVVKSYVYKINLKKANDFESEFAYRSRLEDNYANVPRDLFVCHRSTDNFIAQEVVKELEEDGNTCWISSRNLRPNDNINYWKNITEAIESAKIFLVISSQESMLSKDVQKELSIADKLKRPRIEYKIDDSVHTTLFKHFFDGYKWINAFYSKEEAIKELKSRVLEIQLKRVETQKKEPISKVTDSFSIPSSSNLNINNLVKRMNIELESKDKVKALEYAERILDENVEEYEPWLVKFLLDNDVYNKSDLISKIMSSSNVEYPINVLKQSNFIKMKKFSADNLFETKIEEAIQTFYHKAKNEAFTNKNQSEFIKLSRIYPNQANDLLLSSLMKHRIPHVEYFEKLFDDISNIDNIEVIISDLKRNLSTDLFKNSFKIYENRLNDLIKTREEILEKERILEQERLKEIERKRNDFIAELRDLLKAGDYKLCSNKLENNDILDRTDVSYIEISFLAFYKCSNIEEFIYKFNKEESIELLEHLIHTPIYLEYLKINKNDSFSDMSNNINSIIEAHYARIKKEQKELKIKKFKRSLWYIVPILLVIVVLSILTPTLFIPSANYSEAMELINQGKYEEAKDILSNINNFSDTEKQLVVLSAHEEFQSGNFEEAINLIEEIGTVEIEYDYNGGQNLTQFSYTLLSSITNQNPIRNGYSFVGWELVSYSINNEKDNYSADVSLKAMWNINQYSITFDSNEGTSVETITQDYNSKVVKPEEPEKEGHTFAGWYLDEEFTQEYVFDLMPLENLTVYARWLVNPYRFTLNLNGGIGITEIYDSFGVELEEPIPTREGYTFGGWYLDIGFTQEYTFSTMPSENITLYAKWLLNPHTITLLLNGGEGLTEIYDSYGVTLEEPIPTREGYSFDGWYLDEEFIQEYIFSTMPASNITLYAKWIINQYTITFETNGGTNIEAITQDYNTTVEERSEPERDGYTFSGWYIDSSLLTPYVFSTMPAENITLYAKWSTITYNIDYILDGGNNNSSNPSGYTIETTTFTLNNPTKEGYTFLGWYTEDTYSNELTEVSSGMTGDMTLYASWKINQYTITFETNGGTNIEAITQDYNTTVEEQSEPKRDGYIFSGWYSDNNLLTPYVLSAMPASNITLYAKWSTITYNIEYMLDGGDNNSFNPSGYTIETTTFTLNNPTKEGYTFLGWYTEDTYSNELTEISSGMTGDMTLYAKWSINQYVITFNSNKGSLVSAITQDYNTTVEEPSEPERDGYTFSGWYSDSSLLTPYVFSTMPAENITLYAKWEINQYTISFESNGGSLVESVTQDYATTVIQPTNPSKEGYTFSGWYSDAGLTQEYIFSTMPSEDITVYAKWIINQYTITFNSNEGSAVTSITQDYASAVIEPISPTKEGYTFDGWYSDSSLMTPYVFSIMPADNITLYAKWIVNQYTITFDSTGGSEVDTISQDFNSHIVYPIKPIKENMVFIGWYSDISLETEFYINYMPAENITLYAKWGYYSPNYLVYSDHIEISGFDVAGGYLDNIDLVVPDTYNGLPITIIQSYSFLNQNQIISVVIGNNIQVIEEGAFSGCSNITTMTVPFIGKSRDATSIEGLFGYVFGDTIYDNSVRIEQIYWLTETSTWTNYAYFYFPKNLRTLIITDDSYIYKYSLQNCYFIYDIVLPTNLKSIGTGAFSVQADYNTNRSLVLPQGLQTIGNGAFSGNYGLRNLVIPDSVSYIGSYAFYRCTTLSTVYIPNTVYEVGEYLFGQTSGINVYLEFSSAVELDAKNWRELWSQSVIINYGYSLEDYLNIIS